MYTRHKRFLLASENVFLKTTGRLNALLGLPKIIEHLHGVIKDIHLAKKFSQFFFKLNVTKRGETIFGECRPVLYVFLAKIHTYTFNGLISIPVSICLTLE